jgi:hypothetical protein
MLIERYSFAPSSKEIKWKMGGIAVNGSSTLLALADEPWSVSNSSWGAGRTHAAQDDSFGGNEALISAQMQHHNLVMIL